MSDRSGTAQDIVDLKVGVSSLNGKFDMIQAGVGTVGRGIGDLVEGFRKLAEKVESADKSLGEKIHAADRDFTGFQSEVKSLIRTAKWIGGILTVGIFSAASVLWGVRSETVELRVESRHHAERLAKLDHILEDVAVLKKSLAALPDLTNSIERLAKASIASSPIDFHTTSAVVLRRHHDRYSILLTKSELLPENRGSTLVFIWPLMNTKEDWIRPDLKLESASIPPGNAYSGKSKSVIAAMVAREHRGELTITLDFGDAKGVEWARQQLAAGLQIPVEVVFVHDARSPEPGASEPSLRIIPAPQ